MLNILLLLCMHEKIFPVYNIRDFCYSGSESDFYGNSFPAHITQHRHLILAPHRHDFYISILFTKGDGTHEIDFKSYDIIPGSIFMLFPGQVHTYCSPLPKNIDGYIFFHTRDFFDLYFTNERVKNFPFFSTLLNSPLILLQNAQRKKIEALYREIFEEYTDNRQLMKFHKLSSLVNVLYIELSRIYLPKTIRDKQNLNYLMRLAELEDLLDKNFRGIKYPK
jgi:AraC family transcriptional activator of pobA